MSTGGGGSADSIRFANAHVELGLRTEQLRRAMAGIKNRLQNFAGEMNRLSTRAFQFGAALTAPLVASVKMASDAQEALNRFNVTFDDGAKKAQKFADALAGLTGRSVFEVRDQFAAFTSMFGTAGFQQDQSVEMGRRMTKMAADISSFFDESFVSVAGSLQNALKGVSTAVRRFALNTSDAEISARLLAKGITSGATQAQRMVVIMEALQEQMDIKGATGDAEKTLMQFANLLRMMVAQVKVLAIEIGNTLLPSLQTLLPVIGGLVGGMVAFVKNNPAAVQAYAAAAAGLLALSGAFAVAAAAAVALKVAITLFGGPIVLFATASIAALVAALVKMAPAAWQALRASEALKKSLKGIMDALKAGDLESAWEALVISIKIAFIDMMEANNISIQKMIDIWQLLKDMIVGTIELAVDGLNWIADKAGSVWAGMFGEAPVQRDAEAARKAAQDTVKMLEAEGSPVPENLRRMAEGPLFDPDAAERRAKLEERIAELNEKTAAEIAKREAELRDNPLDTTDIFAEGQQAAPEFEVFGQRPRMNVGAIAGTATLGSGQRFLRAGDKVNREQLDELKEQTAALRNIERHQMARQDPMNALFLDMPANIEPRIDPGV